MSKIKIDYKFKNEDENIKFNCFGILNNNKIIFKDNETNFKLDLDNKIIEREHKDYYLKMDLKEERGLYKVNKLGSYDLDFKVKKYDIKENNIKINYILNEQNFNLEINYEVIK